MRRSRFRVDGGAGALRAPPHPTPAPPATAARHTHVYTSRCHIAVKAIHQVYFIFVATLPEMSADVMIANMSWNMAYVCSVTVPTSALPSALYPSCRSGPAASGGPNLNCGGARRAGSRGRKPVRRGRARRGRVRQATGGRGGVWSVSV